MPKRNFSNRNRNYKGKRFKKNPLKKRSNRRPVFEGNYGKLNNHQLRKEISNEPYNQEKKNG